MYNGLSHMGMCMLQAIESQRSFAVVSICDSGSKLLRKCESSVIYRAPKPAPTRTVVRIELVAEAHQSEAPTPITIDRRGGGCILLGSRETLGFGKATQISNGFDIRKEIKSSAAGYSAYRRGRRVGKDRISKHENWKSKRLNQWK
jgi:hypothetical protein